MHIADTALLVCPETGSALTWDGTNLELSLADGTLTSQDGSQVWPVVDGLPRLYRDADLRGTDRLTRHIHDRLPRVHRPLLRLGLPILQGGGTEHSLREATLEALRLGELTDRPGRPARILEIGIGEGAHVPLVRAALPGGLQAEQWGVDLSETLLHRCRAHWRHNPFDEQAHLVLADAHRLPFPDASFDRTFHVGGLGRFDDPQRVLEEMVRVTAPGGRVVVIGKRLDDKEEPAPAIVAAFRLLTMHEPTVPIDRLQLPAGVEQVVGEQVSRFFSCWSMRRASA